MHKYTRTQLLRSTLYCGKSSVFVWEPENFVLVDVSNEKLRLLPKVLLCTVDVDERSLLVYLVICTRDHKTLFFRHFSGGPEAFSGRNPITGNGSYANESICVARTATQLKNRSHT